ncbi:hypothetical protein TSAR_013949 [Trichomalopsis sarcophagae]|uniref:Uncharacterized protein n=1 Tax=Trichomalopsis sarcophagae TaxID=543379 RepID=A0A232FBP4_9HYME|nr:hypothetical protein TSAR_013949 [Trichomalopsis sarcophagae]
MSVWMCTGCRPLSKLQNTNPYLKEYELHLSRQDTDLVSKCMCRRKAFVRCLSSAAIWWQDYNSNTALPGPFTFLPATEGIACDARVLVAVVHQKTNETGMASHVHHLANPKKEFYLV